MPRLILGRCEDVLPTLEAASFDCVVTDPPYNLNFMSKSWDQSGVAFQPETWEAVARPLKPGGVLMAFGGTRTFHRIACAIEDAGFRIQDTLCWLHGQGFPKHKAHLKPAWEPIILARKPGPLWLGVEEGRIGTGDDVVTFDRLAGERSREQYRTGTCGDVSPSGKGRWPANLALSHHESCRCVGTRRVKGVQKAAGSPGFGMEREDGYEYGTGREYAPDGEADVYQCHPECPVRMLDEQAGPSSVTGKRSERSRNAVVEETAWGVNNHRSTEYANEGGSVSRFFYVAKASKSDRGEGNTHPTVKNTKLMEWLVKLACPEGGTVLDPFAGSGSTLIAARRTGRDAVGIEMEPEYIEIARRRLAELDRQQPLFAGLP